MKWSITVFRSFAFRITLILIIVVFYTSHSFGSRQQDATIVSLKCNINFPNIVMDIVINGFNENESILSKEHTVTIFEDQVPVNRYKIEQIVERNNSSPDVAKKTECLQKYRISFNSSIKPDNRDHRISIQIKDGHEIITDSVVINPRNGLFPIMNDSSIIILLLIIIIILLIVVFIWIVIISRQYSYKKKRKKPVSAPIKYENDDYQENGLDHEISSFIKEEESETDYAFAWLLVKKGPDSGKKYLIQNEQVSIGSSSVNDINLSDETVSQRHAKIHFNKGVFHLYDLVSDKGTFLNGKKLLRPKILNDWDEIRFGQTIVIFRGSSKG